MLLGKSTLSLRPVNRGDIIRIDSGSRRLKKTKVGHPVRSKRLQSSAGISSCSQDVIPTCVVIFASVCIDQSRSHTLKDLHTPGRRSDTMESDKYVGKRKMRAERNEQEDWRKDLSIPIAA